MFVRAELKRRAKEVLSRKYLKLFVACLLCIGWEWIRILRSFRSTSLLSGPTAQWLDAMTITLFGKTYSGLSSLMTLFWSAGSDVYAAFGGCCGADPAGIVLNPLSFGLMNYMKRRPQMRKTPTMYSAASINGKT